jgi:hypothetical protein
MVSVPWLDGGLAWGFCKILAATVGKICCVAGGGKAYQCAVDRRGKGRGPALNSPRAAEYPLHDDEASVSFGPHAGLLRED